MLKMYTHIYILYIQSTKYIFFFKFDPGEYKNIKWSNVLNHISYKLFASIAVTNTTQ